MEVALPVHEENILAQFANGDLTVLPSMKGNEALAREGGHVEEFDTDNASIKTPILDVDHILALCSPQIGANAPQENNQESAGKAAAHEGDTIGAIDSMQTPNRIDMALPKLVDMTPTLRSTVAATPGSTMPTPDSYHKAWLPLRTRASPRRIELSLGRAAQPASTSKEQDRDQADATSAAGSELVVVTATPAERLLTSPGDAHLPFGRRSERSGAIATDPASTSGIKRRRGLLARNSERKDESVAASVDAKVVPSSAAAVEASSVLTGQSSSTSLLISHAKLGKLLQDATSAAAKAASTSASKKASRSTEQDHITVTRPLYL